MNTPGRTTREVAHRTPPRPRRWLTPAVVGLCLAGPWVVALVGRSDGTGGAEAGDWVWASIGVSLAYFTWSDILAPRKQMRRIADKLGWRPPIKEGFQRDALRGDARLAIGGGAHAHDLIEGPDGAQVFRIGHEWDHFVVAVRPLDRPGPYLATTRKRRRTPAPSIGRTITSGDQAFDAVFRTMTESPEFARAFLTPEVRARIAECPAYCLRIDGDRAIAFRASHPNEAVVTGLLEFLDRVLAAVPADAWGAERPTRADPAFRWLLYQ
jgi:hypothetical protein